MIQLQYVRFWLLQESNATTDLIGGGPQTVMWAMGSGYKYRWSFVLPCQPLSHLLLCHQGPYRPQISGQGFGDPDTKYCFRSETAFKQGSFSHLKLLETNNFDPGMEPASSAAPALADGFFTT